nr:hypothetical protein [Micromonospora sp. NBC_00362]
MLDMALYLPKSWCDDPEWRSEAGIPNRCGSRPSRNWQPG